MIVWNHGKRVATIVIEATPDPELGFGGRGEGRIFIPPGEGIDLDILDLKPEKPIPHPPTGENE